MFQFLSVSKLNSKKEKIIKYARHCVNSINNNGGIFLALADQDVQVCPFPPKLVTFDAWLMNNQRL